MSKRIKKSHHNWHHRKPRSLGGDNSDRNVIHVKSSQHQAWHTLFYNCKPHQIAFIINTTWIDPDYEVVVVKKNP